jgi:predicted PurR-regulated permease PerM
MRRLRRRLLPRGWAASNVALLLLLLLVVTAAVTLLVIAVGERVNDVDIDKDIFYTQNDETCKTKVLCLPCEFLDRIIRTGANDG